jgi:DNA-binding PadR family transcriptional regulator
MGELRRADRDLTSLTVLALLLTGPRHPYEMHQMVLATHKDFVTGLPRSLYHAVERLLRDELVRVQETTKDPGRPERTVYALTEAGREALRSQLHRLLACPDPDSTLFVAALSFVATLGIGEALGALRTRGEALAEGVADIDAGLASVSVSVPRLLLIEAEYDRSRLEAERGFVAGLIEDLEAGRLAWPEELTATDLLPELEEDRWTDP